MPGYAVFLSMWALVPSEIALMPSAHHQLFTRSWQPVISHCRLLDQEGSSMQHNGESFFPESLLQCLQNILTSLYWWLCCCNICGLTPPVTGWDVLPAATDLSREADIARVKFFRNTVYAHAEHASIDDATFDTNWKEIRDTLVRLGGATYKVS